MKVSTTAIAACGAVPLMMTLITLRYMTIEKKYTNFRYHHKKIQLFNDNTTYQRLQ